MSYSLTSYTVILFDVGEFHFLIRQAFFGIFSIFIMWYLAQLDPDIWLHRLGLSLFVMLMVPLKTGNKDRLNNIYQNKI